MNTHSLPIKSLQALMDSFQDNDSPALTFYKGKTLGGKLSYAELHERIEWVSHFLEHGLGIKAGSRILILTSNRLEVPVLLMAIFRIGAVAVPLNPTAPAEDWAFIARHARARGLFATRSTSKPCLQES